MVLNDPFLLCTQRTRDSQQFTETLTLGRAAKASLQVKTQAQSLPTQSGLGGYLKLTDWDVEKEVK